MSPLQFVVAVCWLVMTVMFIQALRDCRKIEMPPNERATHGTRYEPEDTE